MRARECRYEREVRLAVLAGFWPEGLAGHARVCDTCREAASVTQALSVLRQSSRTEPPLPTAAQVWWRVQVAQRRSAVAQATRPVRLAQKGALLVGTAGAAAVGLVEWPQIASYLSRWESAWAGGWVTPGLIAAAALAGAALFAGALLGILSAPDARARN